MELLTTVKSRHILVITALALIPFGFGGCGKSESEAPALSGRIAYSSDGNIFTMNADGSNLQQLTDDQNEDAFPRWSPDGKYVVFDRAVSDDVQILAIDTDNSAPSVLFDEPGKNASPDWSPDGTQIVFVSDRDGDDLDIFVADFDGSNIRQLMTNNYRDTFPDWSPSGDRIVFTSDRDGDNEIYVMDADGSNVKQITRSMRQDLFPSWSPDGQKIAFARMSVDTVDLYIVDSDGSNLLQLTDNKIVDDSVIPKVADGYPEWSPDGKWIAFQSTRYGGPQLFVMPSSGGEMFSLTERGVVGNSLSWIADR